MLFIYNVFSILYWTILFFQVDCDKNNYEDDTVSEKSDELPTDNYLFVAIIDVVFTDGSKRTCTGTIIHDNVVITAAHCFYSSIEIEDSPKPELTASFVVIGTKKMFETAYEQYLPIERVIIHPKYKGWTADLALVFTFAGMMSDKPGRVVRLANDKTNADAEVTLFSWGQCKDEKAFGTYRPETETEAETEGETERPNESSDCDDEKTYVPRVTRQVYSHDQSSLRQRKRKRKRVLRQRQRRKKLEQITVARAFTTKTLHRTVSSGEENSYRHHKKNYENKPAFVSREHRTGREMKTKYPPKIHKKTAVANKRMHHRRAYSIASHYRNNWRRKMGDQKNKLTVDVFSFVNMQTCKKQVEKVMPPIYEIRNPHEILCYSSEDHYITEEDSGAPAMRQGRLVAVTVGGVDVDGDRVAIGMKIVCFCSWIAENLPKSGSHIQCCKNCCEVRDNANEGGTTVKHIHKKKRRSKYDY